MGYCTYRDWKDVPFEIVTRGVQTAGLRDEIFMQLIKQTSNCPSR